MNTLDSKKRFPTNPPPSFFFSPVKCLNHLSTQRNNNNKKSDIRSESRGVVERNKAPRQSALSEGSSIFIREEDNGRDPWTCPGRAGPEGGPAGQSLLPCAVRTLWDTWILGITWVLLLSASVGPDVLDR